MSNEYADDNNKNKGVSSLTATKKSWQRPEIVAASFDETETGILIGPEILILLS